MAEKEKEKEKANIIAVAGKGGTGKTVIASLLLRFLAEDRRVLVIDADPAASLPSTLGVTNDRGYKRGDSLSKQCLLLREYAH